MAISTKLRLHAVSGSYDPAAEGGVIDTLTAQVGVPTEYIPAGNLGDVLSEMASAIRRLNGASGFAAAQPGHLQNAEHVMGDANYPTSTIVDPGVARLEVKVGTPEYTTLAIGEGASAFFLNESAQGNAGWNMDELRLSSAPQSYYDYEALFGKAAILDAIVLASEGAPAGVIKYLLDVPTFGLGNQTVRSVNATFSFGLTDWTAGPRTGTQQKNGLAGNIGIVPGGNKEERYKFEGAKSVHRLGNAVTFFISDGMLAQNANFVECASSVDTLLHNGGLDSHARVAQIEFLATPAANETLGVKDQWGHTMTITYVDSAAPGAGEVDIKDRDADPSGGVPATPVQIRMRTFMEIESVAAGGWGADNSKQPFGLSATSSDCVVLVDDSTPTLTRVVSTAQPIGWLGDTDSNGAAFGRFSSASSAIQIITDDDDSLITDSNGKFTQGIKSRPSDIPADVSVDASDGSNGVMKTFEVEAINGSWMYAEINSQIPGAIYGTLYQVNSISGGYNNLLIPEDHGLQWDMSPMAGADLQAKLERLDVYLNGSILAQPEMVYDPQYGLDGFDAALIDASSSGDCSKLHLVCAFEIESHDKFQLLGR